MSRFLCFIAGVAVGELWAGWLVHIAYVCVILALLWTGHHPFNCGG